MCGKRLFLFVLCSLLSSLVFSQVSRSDSETIKTDQQEIVLLTLQGIKLLNLQQSIFNAEKTSLESERKEFESEKESYEKKMQQEIQSLTDEKLQFEREKTDYEISKTLPEKESESLTKLNEELKKVSRSLKWKKVISRVEFYAIISLASYIAYKEIKPPP